MNKTITIGALALLAVLGASPEAMATCRDNVIFKLRNYGTQDAYLQARQDCLRESGVPESAIQFFAEYPGVFTCIATQCYPQVPVLGSCVNGICYNGGGGLGTGTGIPGM